MKSMRRNRKEKCWGVDEILHSAILYCTLLHGMVLYGAALCSTAPRCMVLYCAALCFTKIFGTLWSVNWSLSIYLSRLLSISSSLYLCIFIFPSSSRTLTSISPCRAEIMLSRIRYSSVANSLTALYVK